MAEDWFREVWCSHGRAIVSYCAYSTGSKTDAEDVASDVFLALLERASVRGIPENVEAWLYAVARNRCASYHRATGRQLRLLSRLEGPPQSPGDVSIWNDVELWAAMRALDERSRMVVYLRLFEDRSFPDISRLLGRKESAVKMTYYRALDRIRKSIKPARSGNVSTASSGGVQSVE